MAVANFQVTSYQVKVGFELTGGGGGPKSRGYLLCSNDDGHRFVIYFAAPGTALGAPGYFPDSKFGSISVPVDEMANYVDLVRNEKPIFAYLNSDRPEWNSISTSPEPVGEEET